MTTQSVRDCPSPFLQVEYNFAGCRLPRGGKLVLFVLALLEGGQGHGGQTRGYGRHRTGHDVVAFAGRRRASVLRHLGRLRETGNVTTWTAA